MKKLMNPGQIIAFGFLLIILIGSLLFLLPISQKNPGSLKFIDALFTSTSAVCVTGLSTFDAGSVLTPFGQAVLMLLIQLGGLGFVSLSVGIVMLTGHKIFLKQQKLVKEALNYGSLGGIFSLVKSVLFTTIIIEITGTLLLFPAFLKDYKPLKALWLSLFHSVSSFNNAGFDILGKGNNLFPYRDNTYFLLITSLLIILGGIGFLVIKEVTFKHNFKKFSLHTKVVLTVTVSLLLVGTVIFKITENYDWLNAFFMNTSTRTAGFSTVDLGNMSNAGIIFYSVFMFIGASPTSTGGGIKTTTFLVVLMALYSYISENKTSIFKRTLPKDLLHKAFVIFSIGIGTVVSALLLLSLSNPTIPLKDLIFESVSAFATVGLSTGITPSLSIIGKLVIIVTMFIGRVGPLTIVSLWILKKNNGVSYAEEGLTLG
jgi:trk system potassium uptake protein TrkH